MRHSVRIVHLLYRSLSPIITPLEVNVMIMTGTRVLNNKIRSVSAITFQDRPIYGGLFKHNLTPNNVLTNNNVERAMLLRRNRTINTVKTNIKDSLYRFLYTLVNNNLRLNVTRDREYRVFLYTLDISRHRRFLYRAILANTTNMNGSRRPMVTMLTTLMMTGTGKNNVLIRRPLLRRVMTVPNNSRIQDVLDDYPMILAREGVIRAMLQRSNRLTTTVKTIMKMVSNGFFYADLYDNVRYTTTRTREDRADLYALYISRLRRLVNLKDYIYKRYRGGRRTSRYNTTSRVLRSFRQDIARNIRPLLYYPVGGNISY